MVPVLTWQQKQHFQSFLLSPYLSLIPCIRYICNKTSLKIHLTAIIRIQWIQQNLLILKLFTWVTSEYQACFMSQHKQLRNKSLKRVSTWTCQHTIVKSIRRLVSTPTCWGKKNLLTEPSYVSYILRHFPIWWFVLLYFTYLSKW